MNSRQTPKSTLEDFKINVKIKLSALWVSVMLCYLYGDFFTLFLPHRIENMMNGQWGLGATSAAKNCWSLL